MHLGHVGDIAHPEATDPANHLSQLFLRRQLPTASRAEEPGALPPPQRPIPRADQEKEA